MINQYQPTHTMSYYCKVEKQFGTKLGQETGRFDALVTADPTSILYQHIYSQPVDAADFLTANFEIELIEYVRFYERKPLPADALEHKSSPYPMQYKTLDEIKHEIAEVKEHSEAKAAVPSPNPQTPRPQSAGRVPLQALAARK